MVVKKNPRILSSFSLKVAGFVKGLPGCKEHAATFKTEVIEWDNQQHFSIFKCHLYQRFFPLLLQQIDGEAFLLLTQTDIVKILSIKLGPALKIYNSILMLKNADEE